MRKKIVFLPYDFDTAAGTNNEGALVFSYNLEDTDQTEGGADVFNGQQSVLWKNMRAAFFDEIRAMYQNLRSTGKLSYEKVEQMFEEHQGKWPEAIFNEDAWFKYLAPLVEKGNASYLSMLQGSKAEQRKWWLYNRFRYIDSKYNAGDSLTDVITIRGYAKANVTIEPYADVYASVKYGSYLVQERSARNMQTTLECPLDNVNDTEIYIYSASQLASVGDLSGLMVGYADFSRAVKLQSLKIGDEDAEYSNGNLTELYLGNNELLRSIDVRNCPNLSQAVDLSGCANIEHIYFDGTSVTGLDLPKGGIIKTLHLPGTLANLSVVGHPGITDFVLPSVGNLSTCRLENVGGIDMKAVVNSLPAGCRVRIIGFDWTVASETELTALKATLDTMRGLNENGGNEDTAQLMGRITINTITGAVLKQLKDSYPDITVSYTNISSKCYYWNYNGTSILYTATATNGGNVSYGGSTPTKPSSIAENYTFNGWSRELGGERDLTAQSHVVEDRNLYPVFQATVRTYTVRYYVGNTVIQTKSSVPYGSTVYYEGDTPTNTAQSDPTDYEFTGWEPEAVNIQGNVNCYAQFRYIGMGYKHLLDGNLVGEYENTTVTEVGKYGLYGLLSLRKVSLPNVEKVGLYGLAANSSPLLSEISLPNATTVDNYGFQNQRSLTTVNMPLVATLGTYCFQNCNSLQEVSFPEVTAIPGYCFTGCSKLKKATFPNLVSIGSQGFYGCSLLEEITLPEGMTALGEYALANTALEQIIVPSTVRSIGNRCFHNNSKLKRLFFLGKPNSMGSTVITSCSVLEDIYVSWDLGQLSNAPWGATGATIHYANEGWQEDLDTILAN